MFFIPTKPWKNGWTEGALIIRKLQEAGFQIFLFQVFVHALNTPVLKLRLDMSY